MSSLDQIFKYGPAVEAYFAALGIRLSPVSTILFVDSNSSRALDASDGLHGYSPDTPLATIDYAIGLCTAGKEDVIAVMPGHTETLSTAAAITVDVAGITILGIGQGNNRPLLSIGTGSTTAAPVLITASNVTIKNLAFVGTASGGSKTSLAIRGVSFVTIEDCLFYETANTKELGVGANMGIITIDDSTAASSYITIRRNRVQTVAGGDDTAFVAVYDGSNGCTNLDIDGNVVWGDFNVTVLHLDQGTNTVTGILIRNNTIVNVDASATGNILLVDSGAVAAMLDNRFCTGAGAAAPLSATNASFGIQNYACEANAKGIEYPTTASNFSS